MPLVKNGLKPTKPAPKCSSSYAMNTPVSNIISGEYDFPYADTVPAGGYIATIIDIIDSETKKKKQAIDILYDLEDSDGSVYNILERYPIKSTYIITLTKKLKAEGFVKNHLAEAIGAVEDIVIAYADDDAIGEITSRSRHKAPAPKSQGSLGSRSRKNIPTPAPDDEDDLIDDIENEDLTDFLEEEE